MNQPLYTTEILRLAASLPLRTSLAAPDGRGEKRSATCGSVIRAEVRLGEAGRVAELAQAVQACAFGQASAALVQRFAVGRSREELVAARGELAAWLRGNGEAPATFDVLAPARAKTGRHGAMLLPFDAVIAALKGSGR
jgi:NifU-like protein involved in Fe-S cluster formation